MASLTSTGETKDSNTESSPLVELIVSDVNGIQSFLCPDENEFISGTISTGKTKLEPSALSWSDATPKPSQSAKSEMLHGSTAPKLCYSSNGAYVAITTENSITFQKIGEEVDIENVIQVKNVDFVAFSPLGTYCVTWSRLYKGEKEPNLRIWRVEDRSLVIEFMMVKQPADEAWPVIKFSPDESIAARAVTNEIHFYSNCKFADGPTNKLRLPGVCLFSISPGPSPQRIACFAPGKKGAPGRASMYRFGQFDQAIASKSFFRAEDCIFRWSPNGATVLVETRSSVDATGQSYMGESNLYLLSDRPGGSFEMKVPRTKDGPLHAVAWSPAGKEFAVIAGKMPPNVTLHNPRTGEPVFELGSAPRNTLSYSPQGRFLLVGGFGTLSGDMDFWDIYKRKKMGTRRSTLSVVDFGWSANGRWFQVASTYPRRQVRYLLGSQLYFVIFISHIFQKQIKILIICNYILLLFSFIIFERLKTDTLYTVTMVNLLVK
jgi:translation initiation factor 2A